MSDSAESATDAGWQLQFGRAVGGILYAALSTRPDIAHAAGELASAVSKPTIVDWQACKRLLRYLNGTRTLSLTYGSSATVRSNRVSTSRTEEVITLSAYCDADWGGHKSDRRSTTGFIAQINGSTVCWSS